VPMATGGNPRIKGLGEVALGAATTLDHFAFVTTPKGLDAEHERLEGLGLEVETAVHEWTQWRSIYVRDPERNLVEWVCHDPSISG